MVQGSVNNTEMVTFGNVLAPLKRVLYMPVQIRSFIMDLHTQSFNCGIGPKHPIWSYMSIMKTPLFLVVCAWYLTICECLKTPVAVTCRVRINLQWEF